jgi:hypothetical protein
MFRVVCPSGAMAGAASRLLDFVCQAKEEELEDDDSFMDIDEDEDEIEMVETMMRVDTAAGPTMVRHRTARAKSRQGGPTYSPQVVIVSIFSLLSVTLPPHARTRRHSQTDMRTHIETQKTHETKTWGRTHGTKHEEKKQACHKLTLSHSAVAAIGRALIH